MIAKVVLIILIVVFGTTLLMGLDLLKNLLESIRDSRDEEDDN